MSEETRYGLRQLRWYTTPLHLSLWLIVRMIVVLVWMIGESVMTQAVAKLPVVKKAEQAIEAFRQQSLWNKAKTIDQLLGRLIGNADHIRARGETLTGYAVRMGGMCLFIGAMIVLMALSLAIAFEAAPVQLAKILSAGFGLALLVSALALYPGNFGFAVAFIITSASLAIGSIPSVIQPGAGGTPWGQSLGIGFGMLLVVSIINSLSDAIWRVFNSGEEQQKKQPKPDTFRRMNLAGLATAKERKKRMLLLSALITALVFWVVAFFALLIVLPKSQNAFALIVLSIFLISAIPIAVFYFAVRAMGDLKREIIQRNGGREQVLKLLEGVPLE